MDNIDYKNIAGMCRFTKENADAVTLYTGSKTYIVFMTSEDVHRYKELWETIQSLQRNGIDPKKLLR